MVNYGGDLSYDFCRKNNMKTPGIKSFSENLREMPFDRQIDNLRFNSRLGCTTHIRNNFQRQN